MRSERGFVFQAIGSKPNIMFGLKLTSRLMSTKRIDKPNIYVRFLCSLKRKKENLYSGCSPAILPKKAEASKSWKVCLPVAQADSLRYFVPLMSILSFFYWSPAYIAR
jgi:hypothetical protein